MEAGTAGLPTRSFRGKSCMTHSDRHNSLYFDYRTYPFERPHEMDRQGDQHPVLIVGGGPVGMAVALELALFGVPSVILSAADSESSGSRAACIARRSMEILHRFGMGKAFDEIALPWTSGTTFYRGKPIFRLEMPHGADERHYPMANIQQNILERLMIDCIAEQDLIDLRWQSEVIGAEQDDNGVTLKIATPEGSYGIRGQYAVAADGARSAMRQLLGLKMSGEAHSARYLIADIKLQSDSPTERRAWFDSPVNRGSTILMHKQPHDIWRVDYQLREDNDLEAELQTERLCKRIQDVLDAAGETGDWELDWVSQYRAYSLCLDSYVQGRICFAGDAAHLVPIFGVKGLNSGLADANNLGWKLAAVVSGKAGPALLESYGQERRAATLDIFEAAGKSTRFMTPPTRGYQLMRKGALSLALSESWAGNLADPRQSAPFRYVDSDLNSFVGEDSEFDAGPAIGASAISVRLADDYLHDSFDSRPALIYFASKETSDTACQTLIQHAKGDSALNVLVVGQAPSMLGQDDNITHISDGDGALAEAYGASLGTYYLLRPDWHVVARTRLDPELAQLDTAINRMFGHEG